MYVLCYEVWVENDKGRQMIAAYWDVQVAWKVAEAIQKTHKDFAVEVGVASGMQIVTHSGEEERIKRQDVVSV